jgi:hypothetical protein
MTEFLRAGSLPGALISWTERLKCHSRHASIQGAVVGEMAQIPAKSAIYALFIWLSLLELMDCQTLMLE